MNLVWMLRKHPPEGTKMSLRCFVETQPHGPTWRPLVLQCLGSYPKICKELCKNTDYIIIFTEASGPGVEDS